MQLSKAQFFSAIGAVAVVVALAVWWFVFKPAAAAGSDGGATQVDYMSTDPQFTQPTTADSGGTLPASNAP